MILRMKKRDHKTQLVDLDSGLISYCEAGNSGQTLLLLHGFSFRQGMYPLMDSLKSNFHVVIPDLPFSTKNNFHIVHSLDNYATFLLDFVDHLGLEKVSIFGNSVGGTLGLLCCAAAPGRFETLTVRCPLWSARQLPLYLQVRPLASLHGLLSVNKLYAKSVLNIFYNMSAKLSPVNGGSGQNTPPHRNGQADPVLLSRFLGGLTQVEYESRLHDIPNKTLILWGELDSFISSAWGKYLNRMLPASKYLEMAGEYHNIATTNPKTLSRIISDFVI